MGDSWLQPPPPLHPWGEPRPRHPTPRSTLDAGDQLQRGAAAACAPTLLRAQLPANRLQRARECLSTSTAALTAVHVPYCVLVDLTSLREISRSHQSPAAVRLNSIPSHLYGTPSHLYGSPSKWIYGMSFSHPVSVSHGTVHRSRRRLKQGAVARNGEAALVERSAASTAYNI